MHAHTNNDNWGSTTVAIDWNGYDREMKRHVHMEPRDNIIKFHGYYVQWWGTMRNFSVWTMVDVECNLLDLGQRAQRLHIVNVVGMCGLNIELGWGGYHACKTGHGTGWGAVWCGMYGAVIGGVSRWLVNNINEIAIECTRIICN